MWGRRILNLLRKIENDKGRCLLQLTIVLLFCILGVSTVTGEDWVFYTRYGDSFFYDKKNINNPYEDLRNVIGVWQKIVYDNESVDRIAAHLGVKYADLGESISMIEIDCSSRHAQTKAVTYYDTKGRIIEAKYTTADDWKKITSNSPLIKLYRAICPIEER